MARKKVYNQITSKDLLEQVNPENIQLRDDFMAYLRSVKRSEATIAGYTNDYNIWAVWNLQHNNNKSFPDMKKRELVAFQNWLLNENFNQPARVRRIKAVLSSMQNYIENVLDDEYEDFRPIIRKVESPMNTPVFDKTIMTPDQVQTILQTLVSRKEYQKACMFALAISCGARKSELCRFKVDFFSEENVLYGSLYKTPQIKTKGQGGGKYLSKYVLKSVFDPYLNMWLEERERLGITSEWLFVGSDGEQINAGTLGSWAKTISAIAGVPFYWHSARHYWTSYLLTAGIPNDVVSNLSGWASVDMVSVYDDRDPDEEFAKYFRGGNIVQQKKRSLDEL